MCSSVCVCMCVRVCVCSSLKCRPAINRRHLTVSAAFACILEMLSAALLNAKWNELEQQQQQQQLK